MDLEPAQFTAGERAILGSFWHPVAYVDELGDAPLQVQLLDLDLVLWRSPAGIAVAHDRCPHRGSRLSAGWVSEGTLVCPYHGLHFAADGRCTRVPSQDEATLLSPRLRLDTVSATERYGLVWVCLDGAPRLPLPSWPALEVVGHQRYAARTDWHTSAGRHVENFNDIAHFAWAHAGTFGARERPRLLPEVLEE
ncbi:MAG: aromatic ring-hydroxylating dioxygenase subunit alpha, partial [Betaproteobacteria bacterium]|nr:aromatic ring-hydroxylating dioxygenase subunit alpha [Betaproteobacteria bacterium]